MNRFRASPSQFMTCPKKYICLPRKEVRWITAKRLHYLWKINGNLIGLRDLRLVNDSIILQHKLKLAATINNDNKIRKTRSNYSVNTRRLGARMNTFLRYVGIVSCNVTSLAYVCKRYLKHIISVKSHIEFHRS